MEKPGKPNFAYFPVPEVVTRLGLYVTGVGYDNVPPDSPYPRQKHPELYDFNWRMGRVLPEFQLLFVASGTGDFESRETGSVQIQPGTLIILFPDIWHRYRPSKSDGWFEYWISLGGELLFHWQERGLFSPHRPLTMVQQPEATVRRYRKIIDFGMERPEQDAPLLTAHAMSIVASAIEQAQGSPSSLNGSKSANGGLSSNRSARVSADKFEASEADQVVLQATRIIWNHSHQRISVDGIARQLGIVRRTLERHFREQTGRTVHEELIACRLQRAQRLLGETKVPIKHVAFAAGFSSLSNLCKVFQRELQVSPGEYRARTAKGGFKNS